LVEKKKVDPLERNLSSFETLWRKERLQWIFARKSLVGLERGPKQLETLTNKSIRP